MMTKLAVIGYGNLAKALVKGLLPLGRYAIHAAAPSLAAGQLDSGLYTHPDNLTTLAEAKIIILAVKPHQMQQVLTQVGRHCPEDSLLISVAAGIDLAWLKNFCHAHQAILRAMPNVGAQIGLSATGLLANSSVTPAQKQEVEAIFKAIGTIQWFNTDQEMDQITALVGSGPAYVFKFISAWIKAGQALGLEEKKIKPLILQTLEGSLALARQSLLSLDQLVDQVSSPKGTTAAALGCLEKEGFEDLIQKAIEKAYQRAIELRLPS